MNSQDTPLVSIVLCFYNEEKFLEEAVASVIAQDYENWELILVDDGASDGSTALAKDFARRHYTNIFYMHHAGHCNEGLSASRSLGIGKAKGEFVAFLDAHDAWDHDKLSSEIKTFKANPKATVLLSASLNWNSWTGNKAAKDTTEYIGAPEGLNEAPELMLRLYPLGTGSSPRASTMIVRKEVLDRCEFEESFRGIFEMYEDQAFLCKAYLREAVYVSRSCHTRVRQGIPSVAASVYEAGKYDMVRRYYLQWLRTYLKHKSILNKKVWTILNKASMRYREPLRYQLTQLYPTMIRNFFERLLSRLGLLPVLNR
jgi:glycosyltransferase involved in cell wall biosynthesis